MCLEEQAECLVLGFSEIPGCPKSTLIHVLGLCKGKGENGEQALSSSSCPPSFTAPRA